MEVHLADTHGGDRVTWDEIRMLAEQEGVGEQTVVHMAIHRMITKVFGNDESEEEPTEADIEFLKRRADERVGSAILSTRRIEDVLGIPRVPELD